jgi:hypothetical protein
VSTIALASANSTHRGSGEHPELPFVLQFDDADSPSDAIDALLLTEFVTGRQPWSRTEQLAALRAGSSLVPDDGTVVRVASIGKHGTTLAVGNGWTLRAVTWVGGGGQVTVTAVTSALTDEVVERIVADCAEPPVTDDRTVVGFWHLHTRRGPLRDVRRLSAREWADIRGNYAPSVAEALDGLVAVTPETVSGRLVLLHGPAGTGKTTALRALAHAWRDWCQVDCVLDPESLLADVGYLNHVAVGEDEGDAKRWRLLILEDCDELIRADAKQATGQALARLLNLTDGLLGQGRDVLVAITTNEDLARLHPAVTRPGRCLARVEVGRLPSGETLAERLAREAGRATDAVAPIAIGGYL